MNILDVEKGKIDVLTPIGATPITVPITPRLMRVVPLNIAKVIGDFDEVESSDEN